jgi:hypothetical protein
MADKQKRNFIISEKAWNIMQQYAGIAYKKDKNEISGIACVRRVKHPVSNKDVWEIFEPVILKQENTGTTTELDGDALRDYYVKSATKHGDIRYCWWHSHHTMGAFWSGTDLQEIEAWRNDSWSLALVINLYEEYLLNVSTWEPIEHSEDVPLEIIRNISESTKIQLKEYSELCSKPTPIIQNGWNWKNNGAYSQVGIWNRSFHKSPLEKTDVLPWHGSNNILPYKELIEEVVENIDTLMEECADGSKTYEQYVNEIKAINLALKTRNAKFKIKQIAKGKLLNVTMTMLPADHLKYDDETTEETYDKALAIIDADDIIGGHYYGC